MSANSVHPANAYSRSTWERPSTGSASRVPSDLLVLGGGIVGLSTACEALTRGLRVTLFDEAPDRSATLASAGMLSPYAEPLATTSLLEWMKSGRAAYPAYVARIEETSRCSVELSFPGTLLLGLEGSTEDALRQEAERFRDLGASATFLSSAEARMEEPRLGAVVGAIRLDDEGYVNTRTLHLALRVMFERLGGEWIPLHGLGLAVRHHRVAGVETANGVVLGGAVLNACGALADRFLLPEDLERYRLRAVRGQALRLRPPTAQETIRRVLHAPGTGYLVPQADGTVIVGATSEQVGPFLDVTAGGVRELLAAGERLLPGLADWSFAGAWSGLRPLAGDGAPSLVADSRRGLFHALGLYRHGILLAPVAASRLLKMILDDLGKTTA